MFIVEKLFIFNFYYQLTEDITEYPVTISVKKLLAVHPQIAYVTIKSSSDPTTIQYVDILQRIQDLNEIEEISPADLLNFNMTDLINSHPEVNLPIINNPPTKRSIVGIYDSSDKDYIVKKIDIYESTGPSYDPNLLKDISIESGHTKRTMGNVFNTCVPIINGMWHSARYNLNKDRIEVFDGGSTLNKATSKRVEFLDYSGIGNIEILPINSDMVVTLPNIDWYEGLHIDLDIEFDDIDLTNKQIVFSFAGIPIFPINNKVWIENQTTVGISLSEVKYLDLLVSASTRIDLDSVTTDDNINLEDAIDNQFIGKLIDLTQTFLVVIDNDKPIDYLIEVSDAVSGESCVDRHYNPVLPLINHDSLLFTPFTATIEENNWIIKPERLLHLDGKKVTYGMGNMVIAEPSASNMSPSGLLRMMVLE
jgi:hypothetical protein